MATCKDVVIDVLVNSDSFHSKTPTLGFGCGREAGSGRVGTP